MSLHYRRAIDGLRAVAVVPVILYHAGFSLFGGGYAGVDVFFVISGYLITSIIVAESAAGEFSLPAFYERRARRILPALFFVMLACIPFAWAWMTQGELKSFFQSVAAVALFVSNFLFWDQTGYFVAAAAEKPLLHTWSLAVEEQFYVLFPLFVLLLWRLRRRWMFGAIVVLALASLAFCQYASARYPVANFYLAPSRIWELMVGALLALVGLRHLPARLSQGIARQLLALAGLALVVGSFVLLGRATPFPSLYALAPVLGTALIIAFADDSTAVGRLLAASPLVGIGLISYSAYLWHQPLFAYARLHSPDEPSPATFAVLSVAALVLAYFTWHFVERPFRLRRRLARSAVARGAALASLVLVAIGATGRYTALGSNVQRFNYSADELAAIHPPNGNEAVSHCRWQMPLADFPKIRTCKFGAPDARAPVLLFGDSHADALFSALDRVYRERNTAGLLIKDGYCGAIVGVYDRNRSGARVHRKCIEAHRAMLAYARKISAQGMVVSIRWTFQLYPIKGAIDELDYDNGEGGSGDENYREYHAFDAGRSTAAADAKARAVRDFVESLLATGMPIFLVYPVPEVGWNVADYNFKHLLNGAGLPRVISTDYARFRQRHRFVREQLDAIGVRDNLLRIRPADVFCDTFVPNRCVAQLDGKPLYNDDDHLSDAGAALIAERVVQHMQ